MLLNPSPVHTRTGLKVSMDKTVTQIFTAGYLCRLRSTTLRLHTSLLKVPYLIAGAFLSFLAAASSEP